jgi:hypothetical protein
MHETKLPSKKSLIVSWGILMAMTGLSLWAGDPETSNRLSLAAITIVLIAAGYKAVQVLWVFLNIRASTTTWKATCLGFLTVILAVVWSCAAIGFYLGR